MSEKHKKGVFRHLRKLDVSTAVQKEFIVKMEAVADHSSNQLN